MTTFSRVDGKTCKSVQKMAVDLCWNYEAGWQTECLLEMAIAKGAERP